MIYCIITWLIQPIEYTCRNTNYFDIQKLYSFPVKYALGFHSPLIYSISYAYELVSKSYVCEKTDILNSIKIK